MATRKSIIEDYAEAYERMGSISQLVDDAEIRYFVDLIPKDGKKYRILDLGCAEGKLSMLLAAKGHEVTAVDISQTYLDIAEKSAKDKGLPIRFVKCNIEEGTAELPKGYFDYIYFLNVIEHVKNPAESLHHIRSLLAEDGKLFLNTPNVLTTVNFRDALKDCIRRRYDRRSRPAALHLSCYDYRTLETLLGFVGYKSRLIIDKTPIYKEKARKGKYGLVKRIRELFPQIFPLFSSDLLIECTKAEPYNIVELIESWQKESGR